MKCLWKSWVTNKTYPRRPRGSQSGREKVWDESFQVRAKEPLGSDSHRTISKNSSGCHLLNGHKKCFVLLCPIGQQFLLSSFREFIHDGYCLAAVTRFVHQACACKENFNLSHLRRGFYFSRWTPGRNIPQSFLFANNKITKLFFRTFSF